MPKIDLCLLNRKLIIYMILLCGLLNALSDGKVIYVPNDKSTIQDAINTASDGDKIVVSKGSYYENIKLNGKNINLQSEDPDDTNTVSLTTINGQHAGPVVTFTGTELSTCTLQGFTILMGKSTNGGGILGGDMASFTKATIQKNVITQNSARQYGGGIAFCSGIIQNNIIKANTCSGEFYSYGGGMFYCGGIIRNNTIMSNKAAGVSHSFGGGISDCNGIIQNNIIIANTALLRNFATGGGFYNCLGTIQNNYISQNSADYGGGLSMCHGVIQNNNICQNLSSLGAGLYRCYNIIENNIIYDNTAIQGGGFSFCKGSIINNTIYGNKAMRGSGLFNTTAVISNCIIWGNDKVNNSPILDSSKPSFSCIEDWDTTDSSNISDNPMFVNVENNNFRLLDDSKCIDGGNPADEYNDTCLPPGKGSVRNDIGAYGGNNNCGWFSEEILLNGLSDYIVGKINESSVFADINGDGRTDIADIVFIINNY